MRWILLAAMVSVGCTSDLTAAEQEQLATMAMRAELVPASATNAYAEDPGAAALGRDLFFDERLSADGRIACVTCHDPAEGWSDSSAVSKGVEDREGDRHSMPITAVAFQRWFLWDGRADSLWSQPLKAIENEREMDFTRAEVAHLVAREHAVAYEEIFGVLPDLSAVPARARPGMPEWDALPEPERDAVQRVFANVGKSLEAYQRRLLCADTRFDRWMRGEVQAGDEERAGAAEFLRSGCVRCHSGPAFSDGEVHNIGIGSGREEPDLGRDGAVEMFAMDTFSGVGVYSDDPEAGAARLASMAEETGTLGAFRTASLRGAGQRRFFGHRGHAESLGAFIDSVYDDVHMEASAVGELDGEVRDVDVDDEDALQAFLRMLDCPPVDPALADPGT